MWCGTTPPTLPPAKSWMGSARLEYYPQNFIAMKSREIAGVSLVKGGRVVLTFKPDAEGEKAKKALLDQPSIATANMLGMSIKTGATLITEPSVNPTTGETSAEWVRIAA